ncbi:hypothetical protein KUV65_07730 [Maritalea mobilis]|uniref:DUF6455 family protein n=1 Tax=Maritalea mobilis TaxID=483324 RepID=UPI001C96DB68|nr:DUF6455 family protein [Maritalea mobilis]MBY6201245.1 hypothetical protein [Maritalea mobilis]
MVEEQIHKLGDEKRHYWLALGMANASGADLQRALEEGRISHADWAGVVQRCRSCAWTEGCDCWLKAQEPGATDVPRACPNVTFFDRVLGGQSGD